MDAVSEDYRLLVAKASGENAIRPVDVKDNKFCNIVPGIFYGHESGRDRLWY
jgi:hypothetical protein